MTKKLEHFNRQDIAEHIHRYLTSFPKVIVDDSAKGPTIGYRVRNQKYKFATLHGGSSYQSLVLHVNPGTRNTTVGKEKQKELQKILCFDISSIRKHVLKSNEVYIPLEKINHLNPALGVELIIYYALHVQEHTGGQSLTTVKQ